MEQRIETLLIKEYIKQSISLISMNKDSHKVVYLIRPKFGDITIRVFDEPYKATLWQSLDGGIIRLGINNPVYERSFTEQLYELHRFYGIDYEEEIARAIDNDEFLHYDISELYLKRAIDEHFCEYVQYITKNTYFEITKILSSDIFKEMKQKFLKN